MRRLILIHYAEIGLKKSNKKYFVDKLIGQIKKRMEQEFHQTFKISHILSRILIALDDEIDEISARKVLSKIFGLKNFQFVFEGPLEIAELSQQIIQYMPDVSSYSNFRVSVKRSQLMESNSHESEKSISAELLRNGLDLPAKMKNPDFEINIEFFNDHGYFSYEKIAGVAGISSGTGDKLLSLLSSGLDSPVASYRMMRRGARIIFLHFHAYPFTDMSEIENVKRLVEILSNYQFDTKLYLCPFGEIQKSIAANLDVPEKMRVVLYRRIMLRIAEKIARKDKAKGLITGDSFAQVASQTPSNLFTIHEASNIPLYQPLISFDKEEIVQISRDIETFDISKLPCKDTCSMFSPEHPELKANIFDVLKIEEQLDIERWVNLAFKEIETIFFN